jgi:predicted protein tyrosine phosphatase
MQKRQILDIINGDKSYLPWSLISVYSRRNEEVLTKSNLKKLEKIGCNNTLSMLFSDIDNDKDLIYYTLFKDEIHIFTEKQAMDIIKFIDMVDKQEDQVLIVHCNAGVSRSGAIGTFVCEYLALDYNNFKRENKHILPNLSILKTLRRCSEKDT